MAHDEGRLLVIYKLEQFNPILKENIDCLFSLKTNISKIQVVWPEVGREGVVLPILVLELELRSFVEISRLSKLRLSVEISKEFVED